MRRKEYTHIRVEKPVHDTLKAMAREEKTTINNYIEKLLSQMLTTTEKQNKTTTQRPQRNTGKLVGHQPLGSSNPPLGATNSTSNGVKNNPREDLVKDFKFPHQQVKPKILPSTEQLTAVKPLSTVNY